MLKTAGVLCVLVSVLLTPRLFADIAAIRADKLPQETAILAALDDARQMEPYSKSFSGSWKYPVRKDEVSARLGKDLGLLRSAANAHPNNADLLLLTGLVARYAYNLDVEGSYDTAMDTLERAEKLAPGDVRAGWFRSTLQCQTMKPQDGAAGFLAIGGNNQWDKLPVAFWDDYMECMVVTGMPAHVLRAAEHLDELHAPASAMRAFLAKTAENRFDAFDPKKKYEPKEVWQAEDAGADIEFTSTMCGLRLRAHADWRVNQIGWNNGSCLAYFSTGPYKAATRDLNPSILVLVQRPNGETIEQFARKFTKDGPLTPYSPLICPADPCLAFKQDAAGMYGKDGNGHGRMVIFERDEPKFPGLMFESPTPAPKADPNAGVEYFRPRQVQARIPGKLYYLVLLDAAASIEVPAFNDFDFFLKNLTVE